MRKMIKSFFTIVSVETVRAKIEEEKIRWRISKDHKIIEWICFSNTSDRSSIII